MPMRSPQPAHRFCHHPPSRHLGASRESPPLYAGRGAAHQGSPPACCGRLLKRFVSSRGRTNARFNDRAWHPPDVGELGHRTTRTCARCARVTGTREIPDYLPRSSSGCGHAARRKRVERDLRMHQPHRCARSRRPQQMAEPTQSVKRYADHRLCQPAELCAAAHRGRAAPGGGENTYLAGAPELLLLSQALQGARHSTLRTDTPSVNDQAWYPPDIGEPGANHKHVGRMQPHDIARSGDAGGVRAVQGRGPRTPTGL